jgi:hypothetical protein
LIDRVNTLAFSFAFKSCVCFDNNIFPTSINSALSSFRIPLSWDMTVAHCVWALARLTDSLSLSFLSYNLNLQITKIQDIGG